MKKEEEMVCCLENSERLAELGVKRESYFVWRVSRERYLTPQPIVVPSLTYHVDTYAKQWSVFPAYTVGELGEMLKIVCGPLVQDALSVLIPHSGLLRHAQVKNLLIRLLYDPDLCCSVILCLLENGHFTAEELNNA